MVRLPQGPLQSRNFRLLLACNVTSVTGTAVALVAIPFAVLAIGGSAADVGYVAAAVMVPALIFPLGGVVADRLPRHQVMMAANALQALAQGAAAALVLTGQAQVWELVVLAAARGPDRGFRAGRHPGRPGRPRLGPGRRRRDVRRRHGAAGCHAVPGPAAGTQDGHAARPARGLA